MTKIIALSGSIRKHSYNTKLAKAAVVSLKEKGADANFIDLAAYEMPLYNGDLESESGLPDTARALKAVFVEASGFFIASPEYNSSFSALLKNTIDWISRPSEKGEPALLAFNGKVAGIGATSLGALGGLRGLVPLRMLLGNIGVHVIPNQIALPNATEGFDNDGVISSTPMQAMLERVTTQLLETSKAQARL